jgi:hypothetical protein
MSHILSKGGRILSQGGRVATAVTGADNVIRDGSTVAWYDSSDLTTITKDGSDYVSGWNDKLGSGRDLLQPTGARQPKWVVTDGVLFDGVDDIMIDDFNWNTPQCSYVVFKVVSINSSRDNYLLSGRYLNNGGCVVINSTPRIYLRDNNFVNCYNDTITTSVWYIGRFFSNGLLSSLSLNTNKSINNLTSSVYNTDRFGLGNSRYLGTLASNIQVKEIILRNIADNADDETAIYSYLSAKYGIG